MSRFRPGGVVLIAISSLFFGVMAVCVRLLNGRVPSQQIVTIRFAIGLVGCALLFALRRRGPDLRRWPLLLLRGAAGGLAVLAYFFSIEQLGAAIATVLNYSSPILAALFAAIFLKERSTRTARVALVVATLGAMLVAFSRSRPGSAWVPELGAIAGLASAVAGGAAMTGIRVLRNDTDALTIFFAFCSIGLLMSLPLSLGGWVTPDVSLWPLLIAVGVLSIAGQLLFTFGMGFTSATTGSATTQLVPVLSWVLAVGWLGEPMSVLNGCGAILTVGGVLIGIAAPARRVDVSTPATDAR